MRADEWSVCGRELLSGSGPCTCPALTALLEATYWTGRKTRVEEGKLRGCSELDSLSLSLREGRVTSGRLVDVGPEVMTAMTKYNFGELPLPWFNVTSHLQIRRRQLDGGVNTFGWNFIFSSLKSHSFSKFYFLALVFQRSHSQRDRTRSDIRIGHESF